MAKQRLFPEPPDPDKAGSRQQFDKLASKVFGVPKSEIDEREKQWRKSKHARPKPS